jgi:MoxR-like ATPase
MNVDILVARFRQYYGHTNFQDERFTWEEYTYKLERGQQMHEWLSDEALRQLIEQENWAEVCQRTVQSFNMEGPLARWDEFQWLRDLNPEEQRRFALALQDFLYGEAPFPNRLERFVAEATDVYRHFRDRDRIHQKRYNAKKLSWPFVSYFHFLMWPNQEYVFIKPTPLGKASKAAGFDLRYHSWPNADTYASVQEFYRTLWPAVESLGGRDWIDAQTLIHVAGEGFGVPEGGWIDDPEPAEEGISGWRAKLRQWLRDNPQTMPEELQQLRREFIQRFPSQKLEEITLEEYALGHDAYRDSFCYWLEYKLEDLGSIKGGSVTKFGVWFDHNTGGWKWNKGYKSAQDALSRITTGLLRLVEIVEEGHFDNLDEVGAKTLGSNRYSLRAKPLSLYFPDQFLPISNPAHLRHFLKVFGLNPQGDLHALNRQLLQYLRSLGEFEDFDTRQMMMFLYDCFPPHGVQREPEEEEIEEIAELHPPSLGPVLAHIADSPYIFSEEILTNYHLSLLTKPFVILTGLSGTGKTKLTRLYADAVYGVPDEGTNDCYNIVAVRPDWTDSRGLLGYYNPLTRAYEATPFLRFMLRAAADPQHWYYLCLDEMNLARVEYYFSDFLSAMESGQPVALHSQAECVATRAGDGLAPVLSEAEVQAQGYVVGGVLYVPPTLRIPDNLILSGTVNVDETTHAFSDKVLDRANSIEFSRVDLERYAERYRQRYPDREEMLGEVMPLLRETYDLLEQRYLHFGYRTLEEVLGYLWQNENLPEELRRDWSEALDNQLMQKVLPKLRGDDRIRETLGDLHDLLSDRLGAGSRSVDKLTWMIAELDAFGSTQFWR